MVIPPRISRSGLFFVGIVIFLIIASPLFFLLFRAVQLRQMPLDLFVAPSTWIAIFRTLILAACVAIISVGIALPMAWITFCSDIPGRRIFQVLLSLPLAIPSYVSGFVIMATLGHGGWIHQCLQPLGVETMPDIRGGVGAALALIFTYPFALIVIQAAMARLDPRIWEAARSLGCSPWRAFRQVIIPNLWPSMASGGLLVALYTMGDFGAVSLFRYKSLSYIIYLRNNAIVEIHRHEAVFLSLILVFVAMITVLGLRHIGGNIHRDLNALGHSRSWPIIPLGRYKWPAFAFCTLISLLGVALPTSVVIGWLIRGMQLEHAIGFPFKIASITLFVGIVSACLLTIIAITPGLVSRFGDPRMGRWISIFSYVGYTLPGIVVALALLTMVTSDSYLHGLLYQTTNLLFIAYLIRFLPLAVDTINDALLGLNRSMVDAARSLGASLPLACWRVVLPNARPAMWAGWIAVFIAIIKELPITLLLGPIDIHLPFLEGATPFQTLATRIWTLTGDAYFSEVAPVILLLIGIATVGLALRPDYTSLKEKS